MKQDENEQNYKKIRTTPVVGKKPYGKSQLKDRGVDIKVTNAKYSRPFLIETKGTSSSKSSCENAFVHSLGQIVTRIGNFAFNSCYSLINLTIGNSVNLGFPI